MSGAGLGTRTRGGPCPSRKLSLHQTPGDCGPEDQSPGEDPEEAGMTQAEAVVPHGAALLVMTETNAPKQNSKGKLPESRAHTFPMEYIISAVNKFIF